MLNYIPELISAQLTSAKKTYCTPALRSVINYIGDLFSAQFIFAKKNKVMPLLYLDQFKFFLILCSLEAEEEEATHGAPEAWKKTRERVEETFQVLFHTFVSPAQYILCETTKVHKTKDGDNDEYEDNDDLYKIGRFCLFVCL